VKPYAQMSTDEKLAFLQNEYVKNEKSFVELAELANTYPNKLRRDALALEIKIRDKGAAQKAALKTGRAEHLTAGKKLATTTKTKISERRAAKWASSPEARRKKSEEAKIQWNQMSPEERRVFRKKASIAILKAAKEGSKLEKYLFEKLVEAGYQVQFHKEQILVNERLQIDLFIPKINVAIEVDGPSHFEPIWGRKTLQRNKKSDAEKNGLLLGKGFILIRVQQGSVLTEKFKRDKLNALLKKLSDITIKSPPLGQRYFEL
jgi:very-short-patch-repair endonuclease